MSIFGKEYKNMCRWHARGIKNPDKNQIDFIKELVDLRRSYIQKL